MKHLENDIEDITIPINLEFHTSRDTYFFEVNIKKAEPQGSAIALQTKSALLETDDTRFMLAAIQPPYMNNSERSCSICSYFHYTTFLGV